VFLINISGHQLVVAQYTENRWTVQFCGA